MEDEPFPIIYAYTRKQAVEDGFQISVPVTGKEAGIKFPVYLTRLAYEKCVALPDGYQGCQDERGRLWDVLWMLRCAIRSSDRGDRMEFKLHVRNGTALELLTLKAECGPTDIDDPRPAITIMLPEED